MGDGMVPVVRLNISRSWILYAYPPDQPPDDNHGFALGEEELGQLVEGAVAQLTKELAQRTRELAEARVMIDKLQDALAIKNRDAVLAQMKGP